jgi:hypothetical protein
MQPPGLGVDQPPQLRAESAEQLLGFFDPEQRPDRGRVGDFR